MAEKQDSVHFVLCPLQGNKIEGVVPSRECILGFSFVLNRVRVSNPQRLTYTQRLFEYPTGRTLDAVRFTHERVNI